MTVHKSRVTTTLCISFFAQLELFDLRNIAKLTGKCYRRIRVGDLNAIVIGEVHRTVLVRTDLKPLPIPNAVVTQNSAIVIQDRSRLGVILGVVKGEGLI